MTTQTATTIDQDAANDLEMYHIYQLTYKQYARKQAIQANVARKIKNGSYDPAKAPKLWQYWIDEAARDYCREFGGSVRDIFPKALRQYVAERVAVTEWNEIVDQVARELAWEIARTSDPAKRGEPGAVAAHRKAVEASKRSSVLRAELHSYVSEFIHEIESKR